MPSFRCMYMVPKEDFHRMKNHVCIGNNGDGIHGDINGGQVNHIEIGDGGKVTIKPDGGISAKDDKNSGVLAQPSVGTLSTKDDKNSGVLPPPPVGSLTRPTVGNPPHFVNNIIPPNTHFVNNITPYTNPISSANTGINTVPVSSANTGINTVSPPIRVDTSTNTQISRDVGTNTTPIFSQNVGTNTATLQSVGTSTTPKFSNDSCTNTQSINTTTTGTNTATSESVGVNTDTPPCITSVATNTDIDRSVNTNPENDPFLVNATNTSSKEPFFVDNSVKNPTPSTSRKRQLSTASRFMSNRFSNTKKKCPSTQDSISKPVGKLNSKVDNATQIGRERQESSTQTENNVVQRSIETQFNPSQHNVETQFNYRPPQHNVETQFNYHPSQRSVETQFNYQPSQRSVETQFNHQPSQRSIGTQFLLPSHQKTAYRLMKQKIAKFFENEKSKRKEQALKEVTAPQPLPISTQPAASVDEDDQLLSLTPYKSYKSRAETDSRLANYKNYGISQHAHEKRQESLAQKRKQAKTDVERLFREREEKIRQSKQIEDSIENDIADENHAAATTRGTKRKRGQSLLTRKKPRLMDKSVIRRIEDTMESVIADEELRAESENKTKKRKRNQPNLQKKKPKMSGVTTRNQKKSAKPKLSVKYVDDGVPQMLDKKEQEKIKKQLKKLQSKKKKK